MATLMLSPCDFLEKNLVLRALPKEGRKAEVFLIAEVKRKYRRSDPAVFPKTAVLSLFPKTVVFSLPGDIVSGISDCS